MNRLCSVSQQLVRFTWLTVLAVLVASGPVAAQPAAGIIGQVTDESGLVLPGVTVTVTSPALQVREIVGVTNEQGEYRITPLPIGTYQVDYSLPGFQGVRREGLRLGVGFTASVDVTMKVGGVEETVTVSGAAPVVDVTSAASSTRLTRETLENIPTSRNSIISILAQAPGARPNLDVGGSAANATPSFHAFGQDYEAWQLLDGVVTVSPKSSSQGGVFWDYNAFEEAQIHTIASGAEVPTRGIYLATVVKSGGNDFHGNAWWTQQSPRFQSNNVDQELAAIGVTSGAGLQTRWDVSGDIGGRIIRDKLWFYGALRQREELVNVVNLFKPDGSPAGNHQMGRFFTEKLSFQMSPSNRLTGFHQFARRIYDTGLSQFADWDSRAEIQSGNHTSKVEWQRVKNNLMTTLQFGYWGLFATRVLPSDASPNPATTDQVTRRITGRATSWFDDVREWRRQYQGNVQWLATTRHDLGAGVFYSQARSDRPRPYSRGAAGNYQLVFSNGAPLQLVTYNYPVIPLTRVDYLALHIKDTWAVGPRLTLNLGLRYANDRGYIPEQCREAADFAAAECWPRVEFNTWNPIVPRLHAVYDLTGNGRTVIKGGWSRFGHMRQTDEINSANNNVASNTTYRWSDPNRNRQYDPGEVNLDRNGPDFLSTANQGGILSNGIPNPDEKEPMSDELSVSLERQLIEDVAVRVSGIYSRNFNQYRLANNLRPYEVYNIPVTTRDPGPNGVVGDSDDPGTFVTYYDYPAAYAGVRFQQPMLINDPKADSTFKSVEVAGSKRFDNKWQFQASYAATKKHIPFAGNTTVSILEYTPNDEIFTNDDTWEWLGRMSAAYVFPADVLVSMNLEHRSGEPAPRTVLVRGGRQILTRLVQVEPLGAYRLPNINLFDLRVQKRLRLSQRHEVAVRLNLYNVLNANPVLAMVTQSGATFLRPTSIMQPRIAELSASYKF